MIQERVILLLLLPPRNKCPDGGGDGVLTAPRISISCLIQSDRGQAATLCPPNTHTRKDFVRGKPGVPSIKALIYRVHIMCAHTRDGQGESLVPTDAGKRAAVRTAASSISALAGDAG